MRLEVKNHGTRQIEIKSSFPVLEKRREEYALDLWCLLPATLGVNRKDFGRDRFLEATRSLTRFSPSRLPLSDLVDPACSYSPLVRIRESIGISDDTVLYELRSLAAMYTAESNAAKADLVSDSNEGAAGKVKKRIKATLRDLREFLDQWHALYSLIRKSRGPKKIAEAYRWTDESVGITTEKFLADLFRHVENDEETNSLTNRIRRLAEEVENHAREMGYISPDTASRGTIMEERIYRESILKKWGQSVLYLTHEESAFGKNLNHMVAGIAAAVAMSFAVLSTLLAERFFPGRGLSWALMLIVAYIFKDRIKESLRGILVGAFPSLVSDMRIMLTDRISGKTIGRVNTRIRFGRFRDAPESIRQNAAIKDRYFAGLLPEDDMVHFRREFVIRSGSLLRQHRRLEFLTDIVRINLQEILVRMDDPEKTISVFENGEPVYLKGHRIYPLTLVCRISSNEGTDFQRQYHILLDRNGIRRIEEQSI